MLTVCQGDVFHVIVESDLQSSQLRPVVAGHKVNGVAVCIGVSLYCSIEVGGGTSY